MLLDVPAIFAALNDDILCGGWPVILFLSCSNPAVSLNFGDDMHVYIYRRTVWMPRWFSFDMRFQATKAPQLNVEGQQC